jgi:hypothetical protein
VVRSEEEEWAWDGSGREIWRGCEI